MIQGRPLRCAQPDASAAVLVNPPDFRRRQTFLRAIGRPGALMQPVQPLVSRHPDTSITALMQIIDLETPPG